MGIGAFMQRFRLRLERRAARLRALRRGRQLSAVCGGGDAIPAEGVLLFCTLRNERIRLPHFLDYYRRMGIAHFLFVDNGSDDGTREYLAAQPDTSVWTTRASYRRARFGMDWLNGLLARHGHDRWCLVVDADEFLVYPFCDTRPLEALTDWLDAGGIRSFSAMILDMYPKGPIDETDYTEGQDPFEVAPWFDSGNYTISRNARYRNLWIQGGPRARVFFRERPERAPALNKIPLVRWQRGYAYISSTHALLPRGLNNVYDEWGGEKASGLLLHAKFLPMLAEKSTEEMERRQHFANSHEYRAYASGLAARPDLWCEASERYRNWRQLEELGLMSSGNWA